MRGLQGKRALVTGGSSGLGEAIVYRLAEEGVSVAVGGRDEARAAAVAAEASERSAGGGNEPRHTVVLGDVSVVADCDRMVAEARRALRRPRHPRQLGRHLDREADDRDDRGGVRPPDGRGPQGGVLHVPGGAAPHDGAQERRHRQPRQRLRHPRRAQRGGLLGGQGGGGDDDPRLGHRPRAGRRARVQREPGDLRHADAGQGHRRRGRPAPIRRGWKTPTRSSGSGGRKNWPPPSRFWRATTAASSPAAPSWSTGG